MYYEEQFINGVLMWRNSPDGEWEPCSAETLNMQLFEAKMEIEYEEKRFCELTDMFDSVCKERDELRAQLARCVDALNEIIKPRTLDGWARFDCTDFVESVIDSLPQQAKLDAEVLRCAEEVSFIHDDGCDCLICEAVRAAKENK